MNFEIISKITDVTIIAVAAEFTICLDFEKYMARVAGESSKVWRQFVCEVVGFGWRSYIGTKHSRPWPQRKLKR